MIIYLRNFENDDLYDFLKKVERSYNLDLDNYDLSEIETVSDLAAFINQNASKGIGGNCSSQQSFYKLRDAIAKATATDKRTISPSTLLKAALGKNKRAIGRNVVQQLEVSTSLLTVGGPLCSFLIIGIVLSLSAIFILGWYAFIISLLLIAFLILALRFAATPAFATVGEAAAQLSIENYISMRRNTEINPNETEAVLTALLLGVIGLNEKKDLVKGGYTVKH